MPPTRYFRSAPPDLEWDLRGVSGRTFEDQIAAHLQSYFSYDRANIRIRQTPPSGDKGRDVIIRTNVDITLFGVPIRATSARERKIYVECKLRTGNRLESEFFFDFAQMSDEGTPDYYFLVTNASVTPYVHHKAVTTCAKDEVEFRLIDRRLLVDYLAREAPTLFPLPPATWPDALVVEYQVESSLYATEGRIDIYLVARNYTRDLKPFHVFLATNESWSIVDAPRELSGLAEPLEAHTYKLHAKRRYYDAGADDLDIGVTIDNHRDTIHVAAPKVTFDFQPRMYGANHLATVRRLVREIDGNDGFLLFSVTGQAGVGKSRVIGDALDEFVETNVDVAKIFFQASDRTDDAVRVFERLRIAPPAGSTNAELLVQLFRDLPAAGRSRVLVLEDLHHASKAVLDTVKRVILNPPTVEHPVTVLITGRNDFTFPNEDYFSLLQLLKLVGDADRAVELRPLKKRETLALIRATITNAPDVVVDRVYALSENLPFHVMQAIEYLLETRVAELLSRTEVGIPHVESFPAKQYIPDTIEELYELRFATLRAQPLGDVMADFLTIQSFFGFVVEPIVISEVLNAYDTDAVLAPLVQHRFLEYQLDGELTFCHENLLAVLRAQARRPEHRADASRLVLARPELFALLDDLDQGEVLFLNGAYADALEKFDRIVAAIAKIDNFSSVDLDVKFFHYIDAVFDAAAATGADPHILRNVVLAKAYMGIHNYPLYRGAEACESALAQLDRVDLPASERLVAESEIRQLRAHGLLNMGRTRQALGLMLELDQRIRTEPLLATRHELAFDLYDRLQEAYKKFNHLDVAASYGQLARGVADASANLQLLACHAITEVGMHLYRDPARARASAEHAHELCVQYGAYRLKIYTRLSILIATALEASSPAALAALLPEAREILRVALLENLSDSLMRSQLFVATLTYLLEPRDAAALDEAEQHVNDGISHCAKFGNGLFEWLLYNLAAVLKEARGAKPQVVARLFATAMRGLDRQALLFVGRRDFTYPSLFVISNALRFWSFNEREFHARLDAITDYDTDRTLETRRAAMATIKSERLFFAPTRPFRCLEDPVGQYWLPLL
ncbi:MAG TPA: AAA family ATPase [Thermoanaerobaculia bacterium]|nr:AAA family ATPase [Thermoanaerobaculia bacterium]